VGGYGEGPGTVPGSPLIARRHECFYVLLPGPSLPVWRDGPWFFKKAFSRTMRRMFLKILL